MERKREEEDNERVRFMTGKSSFSSSFLLSREERDSNGEGAKFYGRQGKENADDALGLANLSRVLSLLLSLLLSVFFASKSLTRKLPILGLQTRLVSNNSLLFLFCASFFIVRQKSEGKRRERDLLWKETCYGFG